MQALTDHLQTGGNIDKNEIILNNVLGSDKMPQMLYLTFFSRIRFIVFMQKFRNILDYFKHIE